MVCVHQTGWDWYQASAFPFQCMSNRLWFTKSVSFGGCGQRSWWFISCDAEAGHDSVNSNSITRSHRHVFNRKTSLLSLVDFFKNLQLNFGSTTICSDIWFLMWNSAQRSLTVQLYLTSLSHFPPSSLFIPSVTFALTLSRLFFFFPFPPVACLMSHSCSWQWLTLATLLHCATVVNLFGVTSRGQCYLSQRAIWSHSVQRSESGQPCTGIGPSIQTHYCSESSQTPIPVCHPTTCAHDVSEHTQSGCTHAWARTHTSRAFTHCLISCC